MENRPRIDIPLSPIDKVLEMSSWILLIALWGLTLYHYARLPDIIPIHYNAAGGPDGHGNKVLLFFLPVIATLLQGGLTALNRYPHVFNYPLAITPENARKQYTAATRLIRYLKLAIALIYNMIAYKAVQSAGQGWGTLGAWFLPLVLAIVILPVLYYMIRMAASQDANSPT